jgi:hypothetical protein
MFNFVGGVKIRRFTNREYSQQTTLDTPTDKVPSWAFASERVGRQEFGLTQREVDASNLAFCIIPRRRHAAILEINGLYGDGAGVADRVGR